MYCIVFYIVYHTAAAAVVHTVPPSGSVSLVKVSGPLACVKLAIVPVTTGVASR